MISAPKCKDDWATCQAPGCGNVARSRHGSVCNKHYYRVRRNGSHDLPVRAKGPRLTEGGYVMVSIPGHPMARNDRGHGAYLHRVTLFDSIGLGVHHCIWCGCEVEWKGKGDRMLVVDHLDNDKANNDLSNLAPSCLGCNGARGMFMAWVIAHKDDPVLWAMYEKARAA